MEKEVLDVWNKNKIFNKTLEATTGKPKYIFYDGPPFATGTPHYGHLLAGILKDVVPRYWTMRGHHVERRFGWDCHGLPVENEINKTHGFQTRKQILEYGVGNYNVLCKSIVDRYTSEWKETVQRVGRWVDMDNPYHTMDFSYMQSVWWVFKQLWDKGLVYENYKVVPYSTGLSTSLSASEASQNHQKVQCKSVYVKFKVTGEGNTFFLVWTTTPWTLPANMALCINKDVKYVKVHLVEDETTKYILAHDACDTVLGKGKYVVEHVCFSDELLSMTYEPMFPWFKDVQDKFRVVEASYVTSTTGTGVVHLAPAYGEEDFSVCKKNNVPLVSCVDDDGKFTEEVVPWVGTSVHDATSSVITELKGMSALFKQDTIVHSYPFCYRTNTPLIYRAVKSLFINVEKIKETLIKNNKDNVRWVPEHVKDGRFGNWLDNARDWAVSRNRFWGTPLPVWQNTEGEVLCVGSAEELKELSGVELSNLHLDKLQDITILSTKGNSPLKHINVVFDCWFESGSMPYAQHGYPNSKTKDKFQADFIAEGLDQTRGWFYTLSVIGTALFGTIPFKNVVVNGLVLAEDGKKMAKSLKNYPDPMEVMNEHGADALRLYFLNSPVVHGQELKFSKEEVGEMTRKVLLRLWNAHSFFITYANINEWQPTATMDTNNMSKLDKWILSRLNSLVEHTNKEMENYNLHNVVPALLQFVEEFTNTYLRLNKKFLSSQQTAFDEKSKSFGVMHHVLLKLCVVLAPFTPFIAEKMYDNLSIDENTRKESVHLEQYPQFDHALRNLELEETFKILGEVIVSGRYLREQHNVNMKLPLKTLTLVHHDINILKKLMSVQELMKQELNVREVVYEQDESKFFKVTCKANFKELGQRFGKKMKDVAKAVENMAANDITNLREGRSVCVLDNEQIGPSDVELRYQPVVTSTPLVCGKLCSVVLDVSVGKEQQLEGKLRELVRHVQATRKEMKVKFDDLVDVKFSSTDKEVVEFMTSRKEQLSMEMRTSALEICFGDSNENLVEFFDGSKASVCVHCV